MSVSDECKVYIKAINKIKTSQNKKVKKLSGYNVFCMEERSNLSGSSTEIMTQLGGLWKQCQNKDTYKTKSEKLNEAAAKEAENNQVEDDKQVLELKSQIDELIKQFKKNLKKAEKAAKEAEEAEEADEE